MHVRSVISKHKNLNTWILSTLENVDFTSRTCYIFLWNKSYLKPLFVALTFWVSFASFHALFGVKLSVPLHDALHENYLGFSKDTTVKQIVNLVQLISAFFIVCGPTSDTPNFNFLNSFLSLAKDLLLFNIT